MEEDLVESSCVEVARLRDSCVDVVTLRPVVVVYVAVVCVAHQYLDAMSIDQTVHDNF